MNNTDSIELKHIHMLKQEDVYKDSLTKQLGLKAIEFAQTKDGIDTKMRDAYIAGGLMMLRKIQGK